MRYLPLFILVLFACNGPAEDTDTDEPRDTAVEGSGCPETYIWFNGPEEPRVGDSWDPVLLKCIEDDGEESTLAGPMRITVNPNSAADIDETTVHFLEPGPATLRVQVGSYRVTEIVEVKE